MTGQTNMLSIIIVFTDLSIKVFVCFKAKTVFEMRLVRLVTFKPSIFDRHMGQVTGRAIKESGQRISMVPCVTSPEATQAVSSLRAGH
jgi:siroheme synthase